MTEIELQDYLDDYLEYLEENYSYNTARGRRYAINDLVDHVDEEDEILDLDDEYAAADVIRGFYREAELTKAKVSAVRDFLEFIGRRVSTRDQDKLYTVRELVKYSRVADGAGKQSSKRDINQMREKLIAPKEFKRLFSECDEKTELIVRTLFDTATRAGELAGIMPSDVIDGCDEDGFAAEVKITKKYTSGQGIEEYPKSADGFRRVYLRPKTLSMVQSYVDTQGTPEDEPVFHSYKAVYRSFKQGFRDAGVRTFVDDGKTKTELTPHWVRHTTLTYLLNARELCEDRDNWSKEKLQEYAGHSSVTVTEGYAQFVDSEFFEGIEEVLGFSRK